MLDQPSRPNQLDQPNQPISSRGLAHGWTRGKRKGKRSKSPPTEKTPTQPTDTAWEPGMHQKNNNGDPNNLTRHLQLRQEQQRRGTDGGWSGRGEHQCWTNPADHPTNPPDPPDPTDPTNPSNPTDPRTQKWSLGVSPRSTNSLHWYPQVPVPNERHELQKQPNDRQTGTATDSVSIRRSKQPIRYTNQPI